ncbi:alkaline shock response membrane anchor protein AmaP [Paenibacillus sp. SYP-B4298]|uniref:alkaline shock response membrane anchor protein AmaP n=1 Tax=Paenibacillus sp. SYP-B4298 TaxID=2996034 RepID=UPI0022DD2FBD|nr:alkaline shock response membrane anchor protein AmaP [Paenibacillus sp. SYP-B4298]
MVKIMDRLLLFVYSLIIGILSVFALSMGAGWVHEELAGTWLDALYSELPLQITVISVAVILFLISFRLFYISVKRGNASSPSIDQRTDFGDIRISMETVENLSLKAAGKQKGVRELKARIRVLESGLEITLRAVVDGESSIPALTEEIQRSVKEHVEDITGIPVTSVTVFVANIIQTQTFKSRVE